jgi:hypothetical protein
MKHVLVLVAFAAATSLAACRPSQADPPPVASTAAPLTAAPTASEVTAVFFDRQQQNRDTLFSYQRTQDRRE